MRPALVLLSLLVLTGCHRAERSALRELSVTATAPSAEPEPAWTDAERLALASAAGSAWVDGLLGAAQRYARRNPDKAEPWVALGRLWIRKARESTDPGFHLNADASAQAALARAPDDPAALDLRGIVLLSEHKFDEARALAAQVVAAHPEDPIGYANLSDALLELGRFEAAARAAQRMMDLKPNLASYIRASYLRWLQGDTAAALAFAHHAIDAGRDGRDPEPLAWALVHAAMLFWHAGDYSGAEAGFVMALETVRDYPPALVGKGRVALARGEPRRAAELLARAHDRSPLVETAWLLGDARALAGDAAGAHEAYVRVERDGKASDSRTLADYYATKDREHAAALALCQKELSVRRDPYTLGVYAWALYRTGQFEEAKATIDEALRLGTKDARLLYRSGAIRVALGDHRGGRRLIAQALGQNPKFDVTGAIEARTLLEDGHARLAKH